MTVDSHYGTVVSQRRLTPRGMENVQERGDATNTEASGGHRALPPTPRRWLPQRAASGPAAHRSESETVMPSTDRHQPTIPPIVRTVIYGLGLTVGTASVLIAGIAAVWWPTQAPAILATVGAISSAAAFLTGATGVAYRPTGQELSITTHRAADE